MKTDKAMKTIKNSKKKKNRSKSIMKKIQFFRLRLKTDLFRFNRKIKILYDFFDKNP